MQGPGQDRLGVKGDKVDLQDVVFKMIMDIHMMSGNIRGTGGGEYQRNADNIMYQVAALASTVNYMLRDDVRDRIDKIVTLSRRMYVALKRRNGGSVVSFENQDEVTNITVLTAMMVFQEICDALHRMGYLAEQRKGVVVGEHGLFDVADDEDGDGDDINADAGDEDDGDE